MWERHKEQADSPRRASGFVGSIVRREEYAGGKVIWGIRDGPLYGAMILAAVAGFGIAAAMGAGPGEKAKPVQLADAAAEDAVRPDHMLKIQVVKPAPAAPPPTSAAPIPVDPPKVWSQSVKAEAVPAPAPVRPPAPPPPTQPAPVQLAVRAPSAPVSVPMALRPAAPAPQDDEEVAAAERELAAAYREAEAAGVDARDIRQDRQEWRLARANAAGRSRGALLDAYRDHIDDLQDMADDAAARRQDQRRYPEAREGYGYGQGYGSPYQGGGYGQPYQGYRYGY